MKIKIKLPEWLEQRKSKSKIKRMLRNVYRTYGSQDVFRLPVLLAICSGVIAGFIYHSMGGSFFNAFFIELPIGYIVAYYYLSLTYHEIY